MTQRLKMGAFADGGYRLRVVGPGGNINAPAFGDLVFDSDLPVMNIMQAGDVSLPSVGSASVSIPNQGYIPFVLIGYYCTTRTGGSRGLRGFGNKIKGSPGEVFADTSFIPFDQFTDGSPPSYIGNVSNVDGSTYTYSNRPVACMGYVYRDDNDNGRANREVGMFSADVTASQITFRRWCAAASAGGYAARYAAFSFPAG